MPAQRNAMDDSTHRQWFVTTHWSVVVSAGQADSPRAAESLEKLCRAYRPPVYTYIRRRGSSPADAEDLTHDFFLKLLKKNFWARADPQKGRFRTFLLTALNQFLADQRDRANADKRGGKVSFFSIDGQGGDDQLPAGLDQNLSCQQEFDRRWASMVLEQARTRLRQECIASGKSHLYDRISLLGDKIENPVSYAVLAKEQGLTVSAIKSRVSRLRERYGELVREEVAKTVSNPAEVGPELRHLLAVIGA